MADVDPMYRLCAAAYYATDGWARHAPGAHWVMDLDSYKKVRHAAWVYNGKVDGEDDDPGQWVPDPRDTLFGLPIEVRDGGGEPHLETPQTLKMALTSENTAASIQKRQVRGGSGDG